VIHKHPHWKMLLLPYVVLIATLAVGIWLAFLAKDASSPWNSVGLIAIGVVGLVLLVWLFLVPFRAVAHHAFHRDHRPGHGPRGRDQADRHRQSRCPGSAACASSTA